ncbi:MAG TPA: tetratricopeptide repeat protein [Vicinamibacteria bacterium]|jgi:tetratricopeptide (TPR) repeat protein|nr:tetratricopeptide repeat protein [Vicinamibacteria bacterium]
MTRPGSNRGTKHEGKRRPRQERAISGPRSNPRADSERAAKRRTPRIICLVFLGGLVITLYGRTAGFDFTRTDDKVLLSDDAAFVQDLTNLPRVFGRPFFPKSPRGEVYFRPIVTASFIMDAQWAGIKPRAFHVTNVALHLECTCLLFLLLLRLDFRLWPSLIATAAFAAHPALTEAVAWIPGRCDTLLGIGVLASSLFFLQFLARLDWRPLLGHLAAFAFALLSKEAALVLPVVLSLFVLLVGERRGVLRTPRLWLGWLGVVGLWFVLRLGVAADAGEAVGQRLANLVRHLPILLMHLGKLLFPVNLAVLASARDTVLIPGLIAAGGIAAAGVFLHGRALSVYCWGIAFFALFVLPSLPVSDFLILENRLYVPALGIVIAILAATGSLLGRIGGPILARSAGVAALLLVLVFWAQSWSYTESFRDPLSFTEQAVRSAPHLGLAHLNRGIVHQVEGRVADAEHEYETAIALDPALTVTHNNLGLIYLNRGEIGRGEATFRQEIEINPTYDKAFFNLGLALEREGHPEEALSSWRQAVALNPRNDEARSRLAAVETQIKSGTAPGSPAEASPVAVDQVPTDVLVRLYEEALRREPKNRKIREAYADVCARRGLPCAKEQQEILLRKGNGSGPTTAKTR